MQLVRGRHGASSRLDNMQGKVQPGITDHIAKDLKRHTQVSLFNDAVSRLHSVDDIWLMNTE